MARTHGAGSVRFHQDDGVVLGKGGVAIPTTPTRGVPTLHPHAQPIVLHMDEGEIVVPPKPEAKAAVAYEWHCNSTTWGRNMDGYQALHLLNAILDGELAVVLSDEQVRKLPSDLRWHFRRKTVEVKDETE
jgi:hypothetical protein